MITGPGARGSSADVTSKLSGFDSHGAGPERLEYAGIAWASWSRQTVFAKGYGYRDYEKKLPFTRRHCARLPQTQNYSPLFPRACWSRREADLGQAGPRIRPTIQFYNDQLNQQRHAARYAGAPHGSDAPRLIWFNRFYQEGAVES